MADLDNPGEKGKMIVAGLLGLVAIIFLWWTFFGFGGSNKPRQTQTPVSSTPGRASNAAGRQNNPSELSTLTAEMTPIVYERPNFSVPDPKRNVFAYYEPPPAAKTAGSVPPSTPTPTPPVLLASLSPSNVFAGTADFTLEVSGDKFTPETKISVDGHDLNTRYVGPQQLSAVVPASMIANSGARQVVVRSIDGRLYSNTMALSVAPAPTPNYTYIGIIGTVHHVDTAMLQDRNSKEILNVQRGDVLGGRFRVTSISDKAVVVVDTNLKIRHTLTMSEGDKGPNSPLRQIPKTNADDDEP